MTYYGRYYAPPKNKHCPIKGACILAGLACKPKFHCVWLEYELRVYGERRK